MCIDWEIWTSALVTTTEVRDLLISSVRKYAADGLSSQPLGDWYETTDGSVEGFRARPVVGGHLAHVRPPLRLPLKRLLSIGNLNVIARVDVKGTSMSAA